MQQTVEPTVKLRGAPHSEPPFDDEMEPTVWATAQQLALDWALPEQPVPEPRAPVRRPVVAGASADAKLAVRRFVRLCVEVLSGYRPPAHLRRWSRPGEASEVVAQALVGTRRIAESRRHRPARRPPPVAVIRLRLCEPRPGAVEAAVALVTGDRTWALALRLELHQESWSATTLRLI
jgi:hypothetical protein